MNDGPIFLVDSDQDDQDIVTYAWKELGYKNELQFFHSAETVLHYIETNPTVPFLIICDVNTPRMGGFELKRRILEADNMYYKSIPFVFWSTQASKEQIRKAYDLCVNGFFLKGNNMQEVKASLAAIVEYWRKSEVPE